MPNLSHIDSGSSTSARVGDAHFVQNCVSHSMAEPFHAYGIDSKEARVALDENDGDVAKAGKKLMQMAFARKSLVSATSDQLVEVMMSARMSAQAFRASVEESKSANVDACELVVNAIRVGGASSAKVAEKGCRVLRILAGTNDDNQKRIAEAGGIAMILSMMEVHGASNAGVARKGCAVLWLLAHNNADNKRKIIAANGVSMVERMKSKWKRNEGVKTNANGALRGLR